MHRVLYVKHSDERRPELRIRTSVIEEDDVRYVVKSPVSPKSDAHVASMLRKHDLLEELYRPAGIGVNHCIFDGVNVRFDYIEGRTLESMMDECLQRQDLDGLYGLVETYVSRLLRTDTTHPFRVSEEFTALFGEQAVLEDAVALPASDFDLIFSNVIVDSDGNWNIIDYEWTADFDVPNGFLLYRALTDYLYRSNKRDVLWDQNVYERFGITESDRKTYASMEEHFQKYVSGDGRTLNALAAETNHTEFHVEDAVKAYVPGRVQVFYDRGQGFDEANSKFLTCKIAEDGYYELEIDCDTQVENVRIDPTDRLAMVCLKELSVYTAEGEKKDPHFWTNGAGVDGDIYVYHTDDPQWAIQNVREQQVCTIRIRYSLALVEGNMQNELGARLAAFEVAKAQQSAQKPERRRLFRRL